MCEEFRDKNFNATQKIEKQTKYCLVSIILKILKSLLTTSVDIERAFSSLGHVTGQRRGNYLIKTLEKLERMRSLLKLRTHDVDCEEGLVKLIGDSISEN